MWCGHMKSVKRKIRLGRDVQSHPGIQWVKDYHWESENVMRALLNHNSVWVYALIVFIFLQLILSGDVESNPVPVG